MMTQARLINKIHAQVENFFGGHAADRHLDVRRHPRRCFELVFDHEADFVIVTDGVPLAEIDDRCTSHDW